MASGFLRNGQMEDIKVRGVRKMGSDVLITPNDKFHLGSCTKAMTATLVAIFIEEGKLDWKTTLKDIFSDYELHPLYASTAIETLLVHRSGLPAGHSVMQKTWNMNPTEGRALITKTLLKEPPETIPDARFQYSNYGYIILGHALEVLSGESWESLMTSKIFRPLQMTSCGFGTTSDPKELIPTEPWGHENKNGIITAIQFDNPKAFGPSSTVHCNLTDWGKFLNLHITGFNGEDNLLKKESYQKLHSVHPAKDNPYTYGGWNLLQRSWAQGPVLYHNGSNTLNYANVWIAPLKNAAIMSTTNISGEDALKATDEAISSMIKIHLVP